MPNALFLRDSTIISLYACYVSQDSYIVINARVKDAHVCVFHVEIEKIHLVSAKPIRIYDITRLRQDPSRLFILVSEE